MKSVVFEYIDDHEDEIIKYLMDIVSIKSINPAPTPEEGELKVQEFVNKSFHEFGFETDMFTEDEKNIRPNVIGIYRGKGGGKNLILNGHMDTVIVTEPERWHTDPYKAVLEDGKVYGRGTSDMKGPNAAAIWALKAIKDSGIDLRGDVILQMVSGEESAEGRTIGTAACVKRGYTADFAIVCEPTELEIHSSTASLLCFELIVPGKAAHICARNQVIFPQDSGLPSGQKVGVDAIEKSLPFINYFYRLEKQWSFRWAGKSTVGTGGKPRHDKQGVGAFNINPSLLEAGKYIGAIPGSIKITYALWHPPEVSTEEIMSEIREGVNHIALTDDFLQENPPIVNGPIPQLWPGFVTPEDHPGVMALKKSIEEIEDKEPIVTAFKAVCDGTFLTELGVPSVVFGPGGFSYGVHGDNEFIPVKEVIQAAKIYAQFILNWCS
jgi:acetylornithine deacetylase/succinyl-diaminopimelate desuccinylase family protein